MRARKEEKKEKERERERPPEKVGSCSVYTVFF
jgi:hypothetical protein